MCAAQDAAGALGFAPPPHVSFPLGSGESEGRACLTGLWACGDLTSPPCRDGVAAGPVPTPRHLPASTGPGWGLPPGTHTSSLVPLA